MKNGRTITADRGIPGQRSGSLFVRIWDADPRVLDEEYSAGLMEEAKTEDARMKAERVRKSGWFRALLGKIGL